MPDGLPRTMVACKYHKHWTSPVLIVLLLVGVGFFFTCHISLKTPARMH